LPWKIIGDELRLKQRKGGYSSARAVIAAQGRLKQCKIGLAAQEQSIARVIQSTRVIKSHEQIP